MPKRSSQSNLRQYALIGAAQRVRELEAEIERIRDTFPELRRAAGGPVRRGRRRASLQTVMSGDVAANRPKRRRKMTAAARKRISEAQKARWAKLRGKAKS